MGGRESYRGKRIEIHRENVVIANGFKDEISFENVMSVQGTMESPRVFETKFSRAGSFVFVRATFVLDHIFPMSPQDFGGIPALENGFSFVLLNKEGKKVLDLLGGPIKTNSQFLLRTGPRFMNSITEIKGMGASSLAFCVGLDILGCGILLEPNDRVLAIVRDDLSEMLGFAACIHGYYTRED